MIDYNILLTLFECVIFVGRSLVFGPLAVCVVENKRYVSLAVAKIFDFGKGTQKGRTSGEMQSQ